jgi:hypothetical protein
MRGDRLETVKSPLHVLITGGGLGGLCLAQGLKKSGISAAVYERESSAQFRNQGYRISIKNEGSQALRDCLPEHLFQLCVATTIKTATRLVFLDQQLHLQFAKPLPHPPIPAEEGFGVNRLTLREILLAGLEGMVHFGKTCERFDQVEGGQVFEMLNFSITRWLMWRQTGPRLLKQKHSTNEKCCALGSKPSPLLGTSHTSPARTRHRVNRNKGGPS